MQVEPPKEMHPKRPIIGLKCPRREVSPSPMLSDCVMRTLLEFLVEVVTWFGESTVTTQIAFTLVL